MENKNIDELMWRIQMLQIQTKFCVVLDRSKTGLVCIYLKKLYINLL